MLKQLRVKHFAIIDDLTLSFGQGLHVFSGETGAGKSIIIEALGFALGARGDTTAIKEGADFMRVEAVFTGDMLPEQVRRQYQLDTGEFTLARELDVKGKNKAYVSGKAAKVSDLAQIGQYLVDFHGQHEHQSLLHPAVHLQLLDKFAKHDTIVRQTETAWREVQALQEKLNTARLCAQEKERLLDMAQYQLQEIERIKPTTDEDAQLEQTLPKLKHAGRLLELGSDAYEKLYAAENAATAQTARALKALQSMAELDETLSPLCEKINGALAALEDGAAELGTYKEGIDVDENALDKLLERHEKIKRLKAKYGPEIADVLATAETLKQRINDLQNSEQHEKELSAALEKAQKNLLTLARELHDKRFAAAKKLSALLCEQIRCLGFAQVRFSVAVEMDEENLTSTGADKVEFLFSSNAGQSVRPLKNIASGGEISRVMLGLKAVLAGEVPVMVFDEVDAGIGGETGLLVGEKLRTCAQGRQVLCVTHLAQVAVQADKNFHVSKQTSRQSTRVFIEPLSGEPLTTEIARMLGGNTDKKSAASLHAREMLAQYGR
jgi:DNA repair protein RecN (Recombination protein N)